jgi:ribonuclease E
MPNKMLIDASHPEETRVVVVRGNRIEEFDFESQDKKQLKGNIYLARVTRVEPSLQAAFVEYGGNRHGFLAFSEIHPDYYQIPVADRQALLRAEAEEAEREDDEDGDGEERQERGRGRRRRRGRDRPRGSEAAGQEASETSEAADTSQFSEADDAADIAAAEADADADEHFEVASDGDQPVAAAADHSDDLPDPSTEAGVADEQAGEASQPETADDEDGEHENKSTTSMAAAIEGDVISEPLPDSTTPADDNAAADENRAAADENAPVIEDRGTVEEVSGHHDSEHEVESVGADDAVEEVRAARRRPVRRNYKIQEVIKRRQILLVQVVKEERGNKGAALTTYLSLAGRYSVLMPNTARGGGISRKITNAQDRKRLKEVVADLEVPEGMGVILRTAGESRTKAEIKRDYEYLMRLWEDVRNRTLQSTAPALVYEEGSLIKRSVRDLYNKDIDEILVAGEDGYREAKDFMRMLMPSHAKVVQPFRDTVPIFARNGIEAQLDKMLQPQVTLKSGGYIIINQTEALVSIDVNSGRSTREHSIEDTALQTNLEAAEEVARQLRLRDLAGLIVIDFIDMEENRNNRSVEKKLKDCLKNDRARIQVGRISHFGLLEMSRQRIRASVLESTMKPCPHCGGTGHVRSESSVALMVIRAIEEFLLKDSRNHIMVRMPTATALYILNHKRSMLVDLENRFALRITIEADETLGNQHYAIFRGAVAEKPVGFVEQPATPAYDVVEEDDVDEPIEEEVSEEEADGGTARTEEREDGEGQHDQRRRRRRRRRGGRDRHDHDNGEGVAAQRESAAPSEAGESDEGAADDEPVAAAPEEHAGGDAQKKRRRGKRGGRRNRRDGEANGSEAGDGAAEADDQADLASADAGPAVDTNAAEEIVPETRSRRRGGRARDTGDDRETTREVAEPFSAPAEEAPAEAAVVAATPIAVEEAPAPEDEAPARASRRRSESSEPREPVVSSVISGDAKPAENEAQPKKGGWWQRKSFF